MPDFESVKKEYEELLNALSDPELISNWEKMEELTKRKSVLEKIMEKQKEIEDNKNKIEENRQILKSGEDRELSSLAETETAQLNERQQNLEKELKDLLDNMDREQKSGPNAVIMEIRAGTGGDEAAIFAKDLYKMYSRYAERQGWGQNVLDSSPSVLDGFKEIIFEIKGSGVFNAMRQEGGVHRVQRIPTTEKSGRIHTSTVSVAVLPKPTKTEMKIRPDELRVDFYHSSGAGGQNVNKRMTAVRITHLPSGLVVTSQTERSLMQNKNNAFAILEARLLEKKEIAEAEKVGGNRRSQILGAKRAEKIRTYNFPQDRVTDHRTKESWHNLEKIMDGEIEEIIENMQKSGS
jgi:peptide chain release factor 1